MAYRQTIAANHAGVGIQARRYAAIKQKIGLDKWILIPTIMLAAIGLIMVGSASISVAEGQGLGIHYYTWKHAIFLFLGLILASTFTLVSTEFLYKISKPMMLLGALALLIVFIPGLGKEVNGSIRWIQLGPMSFQTVEAAKLMLIVYMAGYLVRHQQAIQTNFFATLKPILIAGLYMIILLVQPDFGSAVIITFIVGGMLFLAGAAWTHIAILIALVSPVFIWAAMEPYRLRRIVSFMDPWADPFNSGFQLTQALIAIGRGEMFGVGLGASIQKLFYLPEAHTDFIFSVYAEEMGLVGVLLLMLLFITLIGRILMVGLASVRADRPFAGFMAYGVGLWLSFQALVSMGVNMGVLPTKGLTLPLISSGGSSILMTCMALGLVLRIKYELDREMDPRSVRRRELAGGFNDH
ncbi:MAG: putative lipid II flippase FtsW [Xanthomonadales bacterium]|nr:putative lipid II flippase FtsW [Xanthomonadales bacterium]